MYSNQRSYPQKSHALVWWYDRTTFPCVSGKQIFIRNLVFWQGKFGFGGGFSWHSIGKFLHWKSTKIFRQIIKKFYIDRIFSYNWSQMRSHEVPYITAMHGRWELFCRLPLAIIFIAWVRRSIVSWSVLIKSCWWIVLFLANRKQFTTEGPMQASESYHLSIGAVHFTSLLFVKFAVP